MPGSSSGLCAALGSCGRRAPSIGASACPQAATSFEPQPWTSEGVREGGKVASFGKRCLGSLLRSLNVSFQVYFKEGGFAGGKQTP